MRQEIKKEYRICDNCGKKQEKNLGEQSFGVFYNPYEGWLTVKKETYDNQLARMVTSVSTGPSKQFEFDFCEEICLIDFFADRTKKKAKWKI